MSIPVSIPVSSPVRPTAIRLSRMVHATRLRLRGAAPFFSVLALFARVRFSREVEMATTDGRTLWFNPDVFVALPPSQRDALFLHELLHAALLHVSRSAGRDLERFNVAADVVVNGMLADIPSLVIPEPHVRMPAWEQLSVEEVYELLGRDPSPPPLAMADLEVQAGSRLQEADAHADAYADAGGDPGTLIDPDGLDGAPLQGTEAQLRGYWAQAIQLAQVTARSAGIGVLPQQLERALEEVAVPQLDWRTLLWRFVVRTPIDFSGFDRRFLHQGVYLDQLEGESVEVYCCVDTSGSVQPEELALVLGELRAMVSSYPLLRCWLWYADAACHGPWLVEAEQPLPTPIGGGGTHFAPFFEAATAHWGGAGSAVCVYLTDGYGHFPDHAPPLPVMWVVTPGGLASDAFPFGEVTRLR